MVGSPDLVLPLTSSPIADDSLNHTSGATLMALLGTKRSRTTSYHPQSNGMVERFHRQLKAALKAQPNPDAWMISLSFILLGIRTAFKQDLNSTAAEMVYGTTLRLPGQFFTPSPPTPLPDPSEFLNTLRSHFQHIKPIAPRPTATKASPPQLMCLLDAMQFANPFNLPTMDHIPSSSELTNISPSERMVATTTSQLTGSNQHISILPSHCSTPIHRDALAHKHLLPLPPTSCKESTFTTTDDYHYSYNSLWSSCPLSSIFCTQRVRHWGSDVVT